MEEDNNILTQKGQKWIKDQQTKWDDIVQDKLYQLDTIFEEHFQWFRQHRTAKELVLTRRVLIDNDDHTTPTKRFRHDSTHKNITKDQPTTEKIDHVDLTMDNSSLLSDNEQQSSIIKADHVDPIMDTSPIPIEIDLSEEEQDNVDNTTPSLRQHNPNNQTTIPTLKKIINLEVENPTSLRTLSLGRATTILDKDEKRRNTLPPSSQHSQNNKNNNKLATTSPNNSILPKERKQNGRKEVIEIEDEDEENDQVILITQQQLSNSTISNNDRSKRDTINNNDNSNNNNSSEISNDSSFIGNDSSFLSRLFNFELAAGTKRSLLMDHSSSNPNKDDINNSNSNIIKKAKSPISTMTTRTSRFSRFSDDHLEEHTYHDIHNTKSSTPVQPLSSSSTLPSSSSSTLPTSTPKKSEIKADDSTKNDLSKDHQDQTETAQENNKLSNDKEKKGGSKGEIENDKTNFNVNNSEVREMEGKETGAKEMEEKEIGENEVEEEVEVYIPSWATLPELDELLQKQAHMDADKIFGKVPPMQISQIVKFSS